MYMSLNQFNVKIKRISNDLLLKSNIKDEQHSGADKVFRSGVQLTQQSVYFLFRFHQ